MCRCAGFFGKTVKGLPLGALSDLCGSTRFPSECRPPCSSVLRGEAGCLNRAFLRVLRALRGKSHGRPNDLGRSPNDRPNDLRHAFRAIKSALLTTLRMKTPKGLSSSIWATRPFRISDLETAGFYSSGQFICYNTVAENSLLSRADH